MHERLAAMREIWTNDEAEYHGRFVDFDPIWAWPKPVQQPHPPIYLGAYGPRALERVIRHGDGWLPGHLGGKTVPGIEEPIGRIPELQRLAAEAGRGPVPVTVSAAPEDDPGELERMRELGVERLIFWLPIGGRDVVLPAIERVAGLVPA
jgi:alkanesulfonate monooxygenase SsuD/methylene tetrahydromethanopterin reductase-like flavin-dependent oxidoreductase (luciferase family)